MVLSLLDRLLENFDGDLVDFVLVLKFVNLISLFQISIFPKLGLANGGVDDLAELIINVGHAARRLDHVINL